MDRCWLLTSTTYGTWLPGDRRGFVSNVGDKAGSWVRHNLPGTPVDEHMEELEGYARKNLKGKPIYLQQEQAEIGHGEGVPDLTKVRTGRRPSISTGDRR